MSIDDSKDYDLLDRLAGEFADRLRRGERPTVRDYAERYPALADLIREAFPALVTVEEIEEIVQDREQREAPAPAPALSQVGDYRIIREVGHGGMGVVYEAEQVSLGRRVALKVLPRQAGRDHSALERFRREARASARLHHTNIVPVFEIGHDSDVQYYAMQFIQGQSLDRVIDELRRLRGRSLRGHSGRPSPLGHKETRPDNSGTLGLAGELGMPRSLRTGRFDPGATGSPDGVEVPNASNGSIPPGTTSPSAPDSSAVMPGGAQLSTVEARHRVLHRGVAQIGYQVAGALAHAHARGILHRDIKPSNLLLDTEGVAWVSDFGLAKVDDEGLTRTGDVLGTLRYMAPERFRGQADARADVYSLGLTLYELLTLRPAFDPADRLALSEQIRNVEPPRPRSLDPRIPRDLETIVLKAIEKDAGDRYATAEAMGEDLRRFLDDEPILARRAGAPERYLRWARRHPSIAILGGLLSALLIGVTIAAVLVAGRMAALADRDRRAAESEHDAKLIALKAQAQTELQRERAEQSLYTARIGQAEGALRLFDVATARGLLDLCRPEPGAPDRRGWEWSYLDQWCNPELRTLALPPPSSLESHSIALSPDGRLLAVGCALPFSLNSGEFPSVPTYLISLPDGRLRHELGGHIRFVWAVTFRPDGRRLATMGDEGTIRIWDTGSGREVTTISTGRGLAQPGVGVCWSPDGRRLASVAVEGFLRIWDAETGRQTTQIAQKTRAVAWSPDGTRIASALIDTGLEVRGWDESAETLLAPVFRQPGEVQSVCWSPDGRRLAANLRVPESGSPGWWLSVWDATTGERVFRVEDAAELRSIAYSPDGTRLATAGKGGIVRVFDAAEGRERAALFTGSMHVGGLAFSPDGRRLDVVGWGMGAIKSFDPDRDPRGRTIPGWLDQSSALTFDRDGLRILGCDWITGGVLASADPVDGTVDYERVLPVADNRWWPRGDFAFSRDGGRLAAPLRRDRRLIGIWDVALGRTVATLRGSGGPVTAVAFGPDGQSIATAAVGAAGARPFVTHWDLASSRAIRTFEAGRVLVEALAFSDDGRRLAAGGGDMRVSGWVSAWDTESGAVLGKLEHVGHVKSLAFHPNGLHLAAADIGGSKVHLWDLSAGTLITKPGPEGVSCVGFTPDGKRLAVLGFDGNVHLADARTADDILVLRGFSPKSTNGYTPRIAFSPDGSRIAGHFPIFLNLWDLGPRPDRAAEPGAGDLAGWLRRSRALALAGDAAGAEAAAARAGVISGGGAPAWIEHAVSLYRRGVSPGAQAALSRATEALPDEPARWIGLGQLLGHVGWSEASAMVRERARSLCERQLARAPDDEDTAAALAELLPDADAQAGWTVLRPDVMTSAAGATLTRLPDDSVLAGGPIPVADTYTVEAMTGLSGITGFRLEAIPDASLPGRGPGRDSVGNFHLDSIRVFTVSSRSGSVAVPLSRACADYSEPKFAPKGAGGSLDSDPTTAWSIWPLMGQPHWAVFQTARPIGAGVGVRLRVELTSRLKSAQSTLGRFRLSVTNRPFPLIETRLKIIKADAQRNGLTRLGAANILLGDWASAAAVLARAAARPDASAVDGFLLALARHHLGFVDEARSDCDRALERLQSGLPDEVTRDVAVEAMMTIRGQGVDEAEAQLQDLVFPASPFDPWSAKAPAPDRAGPAVGATVP
jgi:WD40 repeat protein/serine/threonine protein kinase